MNQRMLLCPAPLLGSECRRVTVVAAARLGARLRARGRVALATVAAAMVLLFAPAAAAEQLPERLCYPAPTAVSDLAHAESCWLCGFSVPAAAADGEETPNPLAVPICLIEGASGIAPLLVHALDGAHFRAVAPGCADEPPALRAALTRGGEELPGRASDSMMDATIHAARGPLPRPLAPMCLQRLRGSSADLPSGFVPRVYRPPRG